MASNYWVLTSHENIDVFRCRDCERLVKSLDHVCDDDSTVFTEQEVEQIKATS